MTYIGQERVLRLNRMLGRIEFQDWRLQRLSHEGYTGTMSGKNPINGGAVTAKNFGNRERVSMDRDDSRGSGIVKP